MNNGITFIFPSIFFGGHEIMAIEIIKKIIKDEKINIFLYVHANNNLLKEKLLKEELGFTEFSINYSKLRPVTHFFNFNDAKVICGILRREITHSRDVFLIQGSIELGCEFLFWGKLLGIKITSYIPFAHSAYRLRLKLSFFREIINRFYYKMCNQYITISNVFKLQLESYNKYANVRICHNFIDENSKNCQKISVFDFHDDNIFNIFVVGRIVFSHKAQDLVAKAFINLVNKYGAEINQKIKLHFVGDGPDLPALKNMFSYSHIDGLIVFHGWQEKWWDLDVKPDLLVIPSHFEGVPLVMLEAMDKHIPVIASNVDGMVDYLQPDALFDVANVDAIKATILRSVTDPQYIQMCSQYKMSSGEHVNDVSVFYVDQ